MNEINLFYSGLLRRFFHRFQNVTYHNVPICKYIYYQFLCYAMNRWNPAWVKQNCPAFWDESMSSAESEIYNWSETPYLYDPHPGGIILMRGGFGDIASLFLPGERFMLLCPNQAEVDVIKQNRPDLSAHNIESFYRNNYAACKLLCEQFFQVIDGCKSDPLFGNIELFQWLKVQIPEIVRTLDAVQVIFESIHVGAVLTISSIVSMDSALNLIAAANRIPSLTLQHGLILERDLFCHVPVLATKKLVWGNAIREWYRKYGFPESRISVIGSPRFDIIRNKKWCGKENLTRMLEINSSMRIAVYATGTDMETIVPIVLKGLEEIPDLFLAILLHPSESSLVSKYQQLIAGYPNCRVIRFGYISLYDALSGADFFITHCSTAGLEAMLFNLPVITVEPAPSPFSYGDLGASIRVTNAGELNQTINRLMDDESFKINAVNQYRTFLSEYCIPDGLAAKRLFEEVELLSRTGGTA